MPAPDAIDDATDATLRPGPTTVGAALRAWTAALARAGIDNPGVDVRRLLSAVLGVPAAKLLSEPERTLTEEQVSTLSGYVARRVRREPVSRILGRRDFYGRTFAVAPATLDPRPESETLIEAALAIVRQEGWEGRTLRLLDVGTGTGCLLLTLLCELPGASGVGSDISPAALEVARVNAAGLHVADRASWLTADALETASGPFHMLISNPPYVRTSDIAQLEPEVCGFDPTIALDGGADGLAFYRRLAPGIVKVVPDGWTVLEVGYDQADDVAAILSEGIGRVAPADLRVHRDVAGKRRCVAVRTRDRRG
jgi:release factor glutamine methyltransferase